MAFIPRIDWALTQDHFPIQIRLNLGTPELRENKKFALEKADWEAILEETKPSKWMDLDPYIAATNLQKVVVEALEKHCPRKKICDRSRPEWSPRAGELLTGCKRARRQFQRTRSTLDAVEWKQLRNQL